MSDVILTTPQLQEFDCVALLVDTLARGLRRGDVGTIVHVFGGGAGYSVEFFDERNRSKGVTDVSPEQIVRLNFDVRKSA